MKPNVEEELSGKERTGITKVILSINRIILMYMYSMHTLPTHYHADATWS